MMMHLRLVMLASGLLAAQAFLGRTPMVMAARGLDRRTALRQATKIFAAGVPAATILARQARAADTATKTESGLEYTILKEGNGAMPKPGQSVKVHYTGWLDSFDGRKFDSSYDRGRPLSIPAGAGRVIAGWDEMLVSMKVGEKRNVVIPPNMGYGSRGAGGVIPPNSTLYFTMELMSIG